MNFFDIFVQLIGFIAITMNILSVQFNSHWMIMLFKSLGSFMFCLQYLLLGAFTGMIMEVVGVIRNFVFAHNVKNNKSNKKWMIFFSVITIFSGVITTILTWSATLTVLSRLSSNSTTLNVIAVLISTLSISAKLLSTIGYGIKNPHVIRMINLPSSFMWIIYNSIVSSLAGIVSDSMSIVSIIIAEIRFKKKPQDKNTDLPIESNPAE